MSSRFSELTGRFPCRRVGSDPGHHFFGYYNKTNWDCSGRFLLAQRTGEATFRLTPESVAEIGVFDLEQGDRFTVLDETRAWNWQMGSQLQWLDGRPGRQVIYNSRTGDASTRYPNFGATVCDLDSGYRTRLSLPVYVVSPDSRYALCVDYRRLYVTHETIGYSEPGGPFTLPMCPDDDGIHRMDLTTGEAKLVLSYRQMSEVRPVASMRRAIHWVSHIEISPSSGRVLFLHRWTERVADETCFLHRLITMNPDGGDLRILECSDHPLPQLTADFDPASVDTFDYEKSEWQISHPLWKEDGRIIVWSPHAGRIHYHEYNDVEGGEVGVIGAGTLAENGHMTFSPVDKRWLLSDTYPDKETHVRRLILFDCVSGECHDIGHFYADPGLGKENRCDLHPRWRRDGQAVCIDSVHEHERQMYVVDVSGLTGP